MKTLRLGVFGWMLVVSWLGLIIPTAIPASFWYELRDFHIEDGTFVDPPRMTFKRTVHRPFNGVWVSTILTHERGEGKFKIVPNCTIDIPVTAEPGQELPDNLTLSSVISDRCNIKHEGYYQVRAIMVIEPQWFPTKKVIFRSNVFYLSEGRRSSKQMEIPDEFWYNDDGGTPQVGGDDPR